MTDIFERVSRFVETHPDCRTEDVIANVPAIRGVVPAALRRLERAGLLKLDRRAETYRTYGRVAGTAA